MTQLGDRFREAREARGISILEASTATRILPRYLQAIEAGDVHSLPGDVYARGFIRNYAQLLGLPPEEMVTLYRQERGEPTTRIKIVPAAVPPRTRSCFIPSFFVTFFTVLALLAGLYFVLSSQGMLSNQDDSVGVQTTPAPPMPTQWPTPTEPPPGSTQSPLPPAVTTQSPPAADVGTTPAPSAPTPTPEAPVVVEAVVIPVTPPSQGSWFEVNVDGRPDYNGLVRPTETRRWTAQNEVFLNIGDTAVVQLSVNGQPVAGFPGTTRGVPRKVTCTPQGCT